MKKKEYSQPKTLHYAIILILIAMVLEVIGLCVNAIRSDYGDSSVLLAHIFMGISTFSTVKYLIDIENRKINSTINIIISLLLNILFLILIHKFGYTNSFLVTAEIFDIIGAVLLLCPASMLWLRSVQNETA